jgi:hypothetical protein
MVARLLMLPLYFLLLEMSQAVVLYLVTSSNATTAAFALAPWFAKRQQAGSVSGRPSKSSNAAVDPESATTKALLEYRSSTAAPRDFDKNSSMAVAQNSSVPRTPQELSDAAHRKVSSIGTTSASLELGDDPAAQADRLLNTALQLRYQKDIGTAL